MRMLTKARIVALGVAILGVACLGFGSEMTHKASDRGTNVTFYSRSRFNAGVTLPAGTYRMEVPQNTQSPQVMFYKDGKVMATVTAKMVDESKKNSDTRIDSVTKGNAQQITSISPNGWREKLLFNSPSSSPHA